MLSLAFLSTLLSKHLFSWSSSSMIICSSINLSKSFLLLFLWSLIRISCLLLGKIQGTNLLYLNKISYLCMKGMKITSVPSVIVEGKIDLNIVINVEDVLGSMIIIVLGSELVLGKKISVNFGLLCLFTPFSHVLPSTLYRSV